LLDVCARWRVAGGALTLTARCSLLAARCVPLSRIILPKHGTVGDLQDVLYAQTQIPIAYQRLVRGSTGQGLQVRSQLLVDSL
jgi:hypothetical protein